MNDPKTLLKTLTNAEKVRLLSGENMWETSPIPDKEVPSMFMADGPHGLRKQAPDLAGGVAKAIPATCYPSAVVMGSTWNDALIEKVGEAMGNEALEQDIDMILGPGANLKRHPYNGRNFEYFSEDPLVSGKMAAALIRGVQSRGVGTSLKHYAANNQETRRMVTDAIIDEKALRELYLKSFEIAVKEGMPWTVMSAYNKVNGRFASEHPQLLTDLLKNEWGYLGATVSDWGAVNDRIEAIKAGLSLEMPSSGGMHDDAVLAALKTDHALQKALDERVLEVLTLLKKARAKKPKVKAIDPHKVALSAAHEGMVLLKNNHILPFKSTENTALIGAFAKAPRYQGGGSSHINPKHLVTPYDAFLDTFKESLSYADGYKLSTDTVDQALIDEAVRVADNATQVIVIVGLPDSYESEGYDRTHLHLPPNQNALIDALSHHPKLTVVLMNGSPVALPWVDNVPAILDAYLGGEASGEAIRDITLGTINPSGKLAETFPIRMEDFPVDQAFPGGLKQVVYTESIDVGYRAVNRRDIPVLFPFGHGLSYSQFTYKGLNISATHTSVQASLELTNESDRAGYEIVQVYADLPGSAVIRSKNTLVAYQKVWVDAKTTTSITVDIPLNRFHVFHAGKFQLEAGNYTISVGASSQDIRMHDTVQLAGQTLTDASAQNVSLFERLYGPSIPEETSVKPFTLNSTLNDIKETFIGKKMYQKIQKEMQGMFVGDYDESLKLMFEGMVKEMPLRQLISMSNGTLTMRTMKGLIALMNKRVFKAIKTFIN